LGILEGLGVGDWGFLIEDWGCSIFLKLKTIFI